MDWLFFLENPMNNFDSLPKYSQIRAILKYLFIFRFLLPEKVAREIGCGQWNCEFEFEQPQVRSAQQFVHQQQCCTTVARMHSFNFSCQIEILVSKYTAICIIMTDTYSIVGMWGMLLSMYIYSCVCFMWWINWYGAMQQPTATIHPYFELKA